MARIGFIGLGVMGGRITGAVAHQGSHRHRIQPHPRESPMADREGNAVGGLSRGVADGFGLYLRMVTNSAAAQAVIEGPNGILAGVTPGKIFIDMSTVSPDVSRNLPTEVRAKGGDMVDSPVSGSVVTLQQGKLSVMVGGRPETFEEVKGAALDVGPKVTYVGENGLALVMKIATNLSLAVQMLAFSEGVLLAEKSGINREVAVDVLTHSAIASPMVQYRGPFVLQNAGGSLVRRQHDAEGYVARTRTGPPARYPHAHHLRDQ